jgi:hypothetical protein
MSSGCLAPLARLPDDTFTAHGCPGRCFWAFHGIEADVFLIRAAALIGTAFWVVRRRDA